MINIENLHPDYITDGNGNKKSVILSISDFHELIEDIEDLVIAAERRDDRTVSHEELLKELKRNGLI